MNTSPSQSWNCIIGLVLIPWGMQLSIWCHLAILVSLFLSAFRLIIRSVSWIMRICGALQSSTVYLCAGGRRWQCLGGRLHVELTGWAHQRGLGWHLPDEIRCPGCPPVDAPARWWEQWLCSRPSGGRGATLFFLRYLVTFSTEQRLQNSLGGRCSESWGVASPLKWINLLCAFIRFDISYLVKCLMEVWATNFD